ncbi:holin [Serratia phage Parlo]|uniref:Holin n=1 Tax=Serratia phage Parlo TaxID=2557554 RepID=A0A482MGH5_9CAUD|nr:holin [Serratia phage Parlo]QBQ72233.1 holin [Serratia phage Parlo]HEJ7283067.1 hypothetical protein [Serratia marcescens]
MMDDLTSPNGIWGAAGAAVIAIIGGVVWVRKLFASTAADVAGSRAEVNMMDVLQQENRDLRERLTASEKERIEQWQTIADLKGQVSMLQNQVELLNQEIKRLSTAMEAKS